MTTTSTIEPPKKWRLKECARCNGDLFLVKDIYERYWECLQCGYHQDKYEIQYYYHSGTQPICRKS